jgi:hypothetical protein
MMLAKDIRPGMLVHHPKNPTGYHVIDHVKHLSRIDVDGEAQLVEVRLTSNTDGVLYEVPPAREISVVIPASTE